jgi:hypothetical protein
MARNAALLIEQDDGPMDDEPQGPSNGSTIDLTPPPAEGMQARQPQARQRQPEPDIEIVETDDQYRPLNQPQRREAALTDQDEGDGTLLDQRRRDEQRRGNERPAPRRKRVQEGRERTFAEMEALRRQNEELLAWKEQVEGRLSTVDAEGIKTRVSEIDQRIQGQVQRFEQAEDRMTAAMTRLAQGDETASADLKQAMRERDAAVITGNQLENAKRQLVHQSQQRPQAQVRQDQQPQQPPAQQAPELSPRVQAYVEDFVDRHDWYSVDGRDRDSKIMRVLDEEVANDGFRPDTQDYWDELEKRAAEALPHRFQGQQQQAQPQARPRAADPRRNGPMVSGAGERPAKPGSNQVFISPERRDALVKAGVMDADGTVTNKTKFLNICKGYQAIDRENGVGVRQ